MIIFPGNDAYFLTPGSSGTVCNGLRTKEEDTGPKLPKFYRNKVI